MQRWREKLFPSLCATSLTVQLIIGYSSSYNSKGLSYRIRLHTQITTHAETNPLNLSNVIMGDFRREEFEDGYLSKCPPSAFRNLARSGKLFKRSTAGLCEGYVQANVIMLPSRHGEDFIQFCEANSGPLPLLFASKCGQFDAPPLVPDGLSDIRTDIPAFKIFEDGDHTKTSKNLLEFSEKLEDFRFFYLGCSFSFDRLLLSAGVPLRYVDGTATGNVTMFKTKIRCSKRGVFDVNLVVSMRPIPRNLVQRVFEVTSPLDEAHGAPIHIGDPAVLGINDMDSEEYYGCATRIDPDEIRVFWACGVTGLEALKSVKPELAFTHCGGSMFVTDLKLKGPPSGDDPSAEQQPRVIWLSEEQEYASVLSEAAVASLGSLCDVEQGEGHRGVSGMPTGQLLRTALTLSHSSRVTVIVETGTTESNPTATSDDTCLQTAVSLGAFLQLLSKEVSFLTVGELRVYHRLTSMLAKLFRSKDMLLSAIHSEHVPDVSRDANVLQFLTSDKDDRCGLEHIVHMKMCRQQAAEIRHQRHEWSTLETVVSETFPGVCITDITVDENMMHINSRYRVGSSRQRGSYDSPVTTVLPDCGVLCQALLLVHTDPVHDRYRRRGLGFPFTAEEKNVLAKFLEDFR